MNYKWTFQYGLEMVFKILKGLEWNSIIGYDPGLGQSMIQWSLYLRSAMGPRNVVLYMLYCRCS